MHHVIPNIESFTSIVETFSGLGIMSSGLIEAGGTIQTKNELRPSFVKHQIRLGYNNMVEGDLGTNEVLYNLWRSYPKSGFLTAGFSCQPWSKLGDRKGMDDERAVGLKSVLRAAWFLRSSGVLLECVTGAGKDQQVRSLIQHWCDCTGFKASDINLSLADVWPSKRERWWCLLTSPLIPRIPLTPWPKVDDPPTVASVLPVFPQWPKEDIEEITLDLYEINKFIEYGTFYECIVKVNEPMSTALHGWSVQLQACPCGCRQWPLSHERLKSKGLHGGLIGLDYNMHTLLGDHQAFRHVHPWEIALLNGVPPNQDWKPLRQGICGLGQMATPLQSAWVFSHYTSMLATVFGWKNWSTPEQVLWRMFGKLFDARNDLVPENLQHPSVHSFVHSLHTAFRQSHEMRFVPSAINIKQFIDNPHRVGEQFPLVHESCEWAEDLKAHESIPSVPSEKVVKQVETMPETNPLAALGSAEEASRDGQEGESKHGEPQELGRHLSKDEEGEKNAERSEEAASKVYSHHGGICAFSTSSLNSPRSRSAKRKIQNELPEEPPRKDEPLTKGGQTNTREEPGCDQFKATQMDGEDEDADFSPLLQNCIAEIEEEAGRNACLDQDDARESHVILVYRDDSWIPDFLKVSKDQSIGCLTVADDKMQIMNQPISVVDTLGCHIRAVETTTPFQEIFVHYSPAFNKRETCPGLPPSFMGCQEQAYPRLTVLTWQEGWVACDEMNCYLQTIGTSMGIPFVECYDYGKDVDDTLEWRKRCVNLLMNGETQSVVSSILKQHHWIPVVFQKSHCPETCDMIVFSTAEGISLLQPVLEDDMKVDFIPVLMHNNFPNDCGFQTVNILLRIATGEINSESKTSAPFTPKEARCWRSHFAHQLKLTDSCKAMVVPGQMSFGGVKNDDVEEKIIDLLTQHGVSGAEAAKRCQLVFDKIGRPSLLKVVRSSRPWAELKALANAQTPKLQLVMPSELEEVIKNRVKQGKPFGEKKAKQDHKKDGVKISLSPSNVSIPMGMFKQGQSELINQIPLTAIGAEASGVVVVDSQQAQPYLKLARPVSKYGLGLLILDHDAAGVQSVGSVLRFPARCEITSEPIIVTARLVQLGNAEVSRHVPAQPLKIEEAETDVIRVIVYQDEFPQDWTQFIQQPVKQILQTQPLFESASGDGQGVVDVWDRQYLGSKYEKQPPQKASIFMVNIRVVGIDVPLMMQSSGSEGMYFEPRTNDGRHPDGNYRVIWLTKTEKATALSAQQTTDSWSCLVRAGHRYGIRTTWDKAPMVHAKHKPHIPYLDAVDMLTFKAGPFPYGTTKRFSSKKFW